ncbi:MAG: response regulator [Thermodesulfobacteriota bacterium]
MNDKRPYRVLIFDDDDSIRKLLWGYFDGRKYEVFTFPDPKSCNLCDIQSCDCPTQEACADIIISDLNMPFMKGLDFLELQIKKGCKCRHLALMSGDLTVADADRAKPLGIKLFKKPFRIREIDEWVKKVEGEIPAGRQLTDWYFNDRR